MANHTKMLANKLNFHAARIVRGKASTRCINAAFWMREASEALHSIPVINERDRKKIQQTIEVLRLHSKQPKTATGTASCLRYAATLLECISSRLTKAGD